MSTHKHIDRICVAIIVLSLLLTVLFMNGESLGLTSSPYSMAYEDSLFDTSRVHTIDIVIDDWDAFLETATSEEYTVCSVIIDNKAVRNVAIRGKGNTSLSTVSSMGSQRYSFKIEFDHYDSGKTYKGLDKLCLNNLIQDNTYMKDYLAYQLMAEFGVDAPLCSYAWVTVNGEDWGLYLAVEAVEDSFMEREYNGEGDLYKPDSLSMGGGGPGNGMGFNLEDFISENAEAMGFPWNRNSDSEDSTETETAAEQTENTGSFPPQDSGFNGGGFSGMPSFGQGSENSSFGGMPSFGQSSGSSDDQDSRPSMSFGGGMPFGMPDGMEMPDSLEMPDGMEMPEGMEKPGGMGGGMPGGIGMGSSDVKLQYTDDDPDSYSNIFDNAKSTVTESDKARLIRSLKALSEGENLEEVLDIDEVLRYFVVHNYLVNSDSYTGAMVHNYYIREADGKLSMIPWDYNLAFGTFQASSATDSVNDPIDTPLSVSGDGSRPMVDWIFQNEEYTELYHQLFAEFLDEIDITALIDETYALIASYVEKDPTAFCTYEEFEAGVSTLRSFCEKRTESIRGQLDGTIPSTDAGQKEDSSSLIDASELNLSDMGSMGGGGGFGGGGSFGPGDRSDKDSQSGQGFPSQGSGFGGGGFSGMPSFGQGSENGGFGGMPSFGQSSGEGNFTPPDMGNGSFQPSETDNGSFQFPDAENGSETAGGEDRRDNAPGSFTPGNMPDMPFGTGSSASTISWTPVILSAAVLIAGLLAAFLYKKRS